MPDTTNGSPPFDHAQFLTKHFNMPDGVIGLLGKYGTYPPTRPAVVKWFTRGSIPADWFPVLLYVLEQENGEPLSMGPYFEVTNPKEARENGIFG